MLDNKDLDKSRADRFDKQNVSAWVDNEWVDNELDAFASEESFAIESEEMQLWSRYHLIGQVMREEVQHLDLDIASRVNAQIANEPEHSVEVSQPKSNVINFPSNPFKQIAGYAIAASVALVVLFNVGNQNTTNFQVSPMTTVASNDAAPLTTAEPTSLSRVERQELQTIHDMFLKHESLSQSSLLPSVQVVSNQKVIPVSVSMMAEQSETQQPTPLKVEKEQAESQ